MSRSNFEENQSVEDLCSAVFWHSKVTNRVDLDYAAYGFIYKIESPSGRVYIGQSKSINNRMRSYKAIKSIKHQRKLSASILKYGWINHSVSIINFANDQEELNNTEISEIDRHKKIYGNLMLNVATGGTNFMWEKLSPESRKRGIETKRKNGTLFGRKNTPETIRLMSELAKKRGVSERARIARRISVMCNETGVVYESMAEASRKTGVHEQVIKDSSTGRYKTTVCGLTFKKVKQTK